MAGDKLAMVAVGRNGSHTRGVPSTADRLPGSRRQTHTDLVPLWTLNIRGIAWQAWITHTHNQGVTAMHEKTRENRLCRPGPPSRPEPHQVPQRRRIGHIDVDTNGLVLGDRDNVGVGYDLDVIEGELSQRRLVRP